MDGRDPVSGREVGAAVLGLHKVTKSFGGITAVKELDLGVQEAEMVGLIGPNGSGKTVSVNLCTGVYPPDSGCISFQGVSISGKRPWDISRLGISRTFQTIRVWGKMTVLENVMLPALIKRTTERMRISEIQKKAEAILGLVGLGDRKSHRPAELSGGESQRAAIARSLINSPVVLLCDEPTGNLDSRSGRGILELFGALWRDGVTVVLITHDMQIARNCTRVVMLRDGRIVYDGPEVPAEDLAEEAPLTLGVNA